MYHYFPFPRLSIARVTKATSLIFIVLEPLGVSGATIASVKCNRLRKSASRSLRYCAISFLEKATRCIAVHIPTSIRNDTRSNNFAFGCDLTHFLSFRFIRTGIRLVGYHSIDIIEMPRLTRGTKLRHVSNNIAMGTWLEFYSSLG